MRRVVLLGIPDTKRTIYLEKAAELEGLSVVFADWKNWENCFGQWGLSTADEQLVKIDPPVWSSCSLEELNHLADGYVHQLETLGRLAQTQNTAFLNTPSAIAELLDKRACKTRLRQAGLPVTEAVHISACPDDGKITAKLLFEEMRRQRIHQVFIKPVKGSGAAGVSALRWQPQTGQIALYSCALIQADGTLVNTRRLRRFSKKEKVLPFLDRILEMDCIVERWYAKAEHQGYSYDLRAVVQDGRLDFLLGRLSKGPITNLHLNNHPLEIAALKLPEHTLEDIAILCRKSMEIYPGLRSAGIDILLEKGSMKPRIIEMNAQGDLIYQDIYNENSIYNHQARMMHEWQKEN
ncbi:MAG: STM4014 family protein [Lachnospiraceae bacterium]|nr:STM4014 family protein [Lachnospiraceae bacterium]